MIPFLSIIATIIGGFFLIILFKPSRPFPVSPQSIINPSKTTIPEPTPSLSPLPVQKIIPQRSHDYQTFNNCGPAALSMALSYFDINVTQQKLGIELRPFQNPQGDNDDKSVTLDELAKKAEEFNLLAYHRPTGDIRTLKLLISYNLPVITRTWLKEGDDIGHYRLIRGFDDTQEQFIQDDSLQGTNLKYTYDEFLVLWQGFNYEYLVLIPKEKQEVAERILGENTNERKAWEKALQIAQEQLTENPANIFTRFNLSVAYYYLGDYQKSVDNFELVEEKLPFRMLWYQIEPILAYQKLKKYDKVFLLTDKILRNYNRAFSELYHIRGQIYLKQGKTNLANSEFEKARFYNKNYITSE